MLRARKSRYAAFASARINRAFFIEFFIYLNFDGGYMCMIVCLRIIFLGMGL